MQRPNLRGHELTPNSKPITNRQLHPGADQSNHSSVNISKNTLEGSGRYRNFSLNELRPSPGRVQGRSSMMRESLHGEPPDYNAKILSKLKERIEELQKQNKSLYDLNVEYEQERILWEQKAKRLNEQLVRYQDRYLQGTSNTRQIQIQQELYQRQIEQYKRSLLALEENNASNQKTILSLTQQIQQIRMEEYNSKDSKQIQQAYNNLSEEYQSTKQQLQLFQRRSKQAQEEICKLEEQLSFMSKQIPQKITIVEQEKKALNEKLIHQKSLYQSKILDMKKQLMHEREEKERWQQENMKLRRQNGHLEDQKLKIQRQSQNYSDQIAKMKQNGFHQQSKLEQKIAGLQRQLRRQKDQAKFKLQTANNQNQILKEAISHKEKEILELQTKVKGFSSELASSITELQKQTVNANALALKNAHAQSLVYKQQISMLNSTVSKLNKEINEIQASYIRQRNQSHQDIQHLERHIRELQSNHQQEKRSLLQSVDIDITDLGNLVKQQQNQIVNIHQKYCQEIQNIIAQNTLLKKSLEMAKVQFQEERAFLQSRINEQKQYSYTSQTLKMQVEKLTLELEQHKATTASLMQNHLSAEERFVEEHEKVTHLTLEIRKNQNQIEQLHQQIQKWRSYRKSEEQDARKECRRFKKRVQELELNQQESDLITSELEAFQRKCQQLKLQIAGQQKEYNRRLQEQKVKLGEAIGEMQTEMRKILREYDIQKASKQEEMQRLIQQNSVQLRQIDQLAELNRQTKLLHQTHNSASHQLQIQNQLLKKELIFAKSQIARIQALMKKQESQSLSLRYTSDTQKDLIKARYDKDMEEKVTEIQKLKLQIAYLSEQLKAHLGGRKQIQALELVIKNKEAEERQAVQRYRYLQSMTETYLGEIRGLKAMREKDCTQKRKLQDIVESLQRKIGSKEAQFNYQVSRLTKGNDQRYRQLQRELKQVRDKNQQITTENRKLQNSLSQVASKQREGARTLKDYQNKIKQLNQEMQYRTTKLDRNQEQRISQYQSQLRDWKSKCESLQAQKNKIESKLSQAAIKEKNLQKLLRQKELSSNELQESIKKSKSQIQDLKYKRGLLQERLNIATKETQLMNEEKEKRLQAEEKQVAYKRIIEQQKQKIDNYCKQQIQRRKQIEILCSKIHTLQAQLKSQSAKPTQNIQTDMNKSKRIQCYLNIGNLNLLGKNTCKLTYDGDEILFLKVLTDTLKTLNNQLVQCLQQISNKKRTILQLTEQKENLNLKYIKYKAFALQYKQKKQMQRYVLKNTYRFNEEIITHCQEIIKNDRK